MSIFQAETSDMVNFKGCENADGLLGFYSSHNGYWQVKGSRPMGQQSKWACAKACLQNCVAISLIGHNCRHYDDQSLLIKENEIEDNDYGSAYIKCTGSYQ